MANIIKLMVLILMIMACFGRKHKIYIDHDVRNHIALSTFDFYKRGFLDVKLINFVSQPMQKSDVFGFSLYRTENDIISPYLNAYHENCVLKEDLSNEYDIAIIHFIFNFYSNLITINCSPRWKQPLHIYNNTNEIPAAFFQSNSFDDKLWRGISDTTPLVCAHALPLASETINNVTYYNASFVIHVSNDSEQGLYNLYFHSCPNYVPDNILFYNFTMEIIEENAGSYLSANEMPLPVLYCIMAVLFFLSGCAWVHLLKQIKHPIFKIHYLMAILVFTKSISLVLRGIYYHYIEINGVPLATWTVLFYVAYFSKNVLLVTTISLISMGWTFIKNVLSVKEKIIFIVIILLQILSSAIDIKLEETERGQTEYKTLRTVFILLDLLCCGFILVPVVWSIRQLKSAPGTLVNLRKIKLFRYFYVMLVIYIYCSRIMVYLLHVTVPFQYGWLQELFREVTMFIFFVLIGYKFRPEVLRENGTMERFTSANAGIRSKHGVFIAEVTEEEKDALLLENENNDQNN